MIYTSLPPRLGCSVDTNVISRVNSQLFFSELGKFLIPPSVDPPLEFIFPTHSKLFCQISPKFFHPKIFQKYYLTYPNFYQQFSNNISKILQKYRNF